MSEGLVRTQRPLTRWGIHALIDLVIAAVGTGVATESRDLSIRASPSKTARAVCASATTDNTQPSLHT